MSEADRFRRHGEAPATATGARTALFVRRVHQASELTDDDWRYSDALMLALRQALTRQST